MLCGWIFVSCQTAPAICNRTRACLRSDDEDISKGLAPDATVDLPPEKRGPAAAASSSQDERDAYSSTDDMVLQSAEDLRERRSRCEDGSSQGHILCVKALTTDAAQSYHLLCTMLHPY